MEVKCELHVAVDFTLETPACILQAAGRSVEEVRKLSKRNNLLPSLKWEPSYRTDLALGKISIKLSQLMLRRRMEEEIDSSTYSSRQH
jgi:hypothetical protein